MKKTWNGGNSKKKSKSFENLKQDWNIEGYLMTGHIIDQLEKRGITREEVEEALEYGQRRPHPHYDNQVIIRCGSHRIVLDNTGNVLITMFENSRTTNKYKDR